MKKYILLILLLILLCGCKHQISKGVVVEKTHRNSWGSLLPMYNGKTITYIPMCYPEEYLITVQDEESSEVFIVDVQEYQKYEVGDSVYFNKEESKWKHKSYQ